METFEEMIARRESEAKQFEKKYAGNPERLAADLSEAIQAIEKSGYIVRAYENYEFGKRSDTLPVAYEIMHSDHSVVYGYGTCDAEQVMCFAVNACNVTTDADDDVDAETAETAEPAPLYGADQAKEREYDQVYNEGGEGYNPYRIGSAHTYK